MPDIAPPPNETTPTGETPPSTPPQGGEPAKLETTGFKWGSEAPQYLQGKGPSETLDVVNRLASAVQQLAAQQQTVQPTQQTMQTAEQLDDDLLVTNPAEWRRRFQAQQQQQTVQTMAQYAAPVYANMAETNAALSKQDAANSEALKYWGEVEALVANIPYHMRTKAVYDQAAKVARSNHVDEIANERAQKLAAAGTGIEGVTRTTNPDGTVSVDPQEALWDKIKATPLGAKMLTQHGKSKVIAAAKAMGGLEAYAEMLSKSKTTFDPDKPGNMYTELI